MLFNSVTYLLFLFVIVTLYWTLPRTPRLYLVFLSSITFYGFWKFTFVPVMLASVICDYFIAKRIYSEKQKLAKKYWLIISLIFNLGLLFYFKYLIFFTDSAFGLANMIGLQADPFILNIILPIGISFYTFQTISYTVDVYRGFIKPENNFILFASYVTFFPQLVAGPILRAVEVIPQLDKRPTFKLSSFENGIRRIIFGLFLKVVLADNLAPLVDSGFSTSVDNLSAVDVWTLAFLFGFQIYFDFCAYSHIALGSARLMGIQFPENFNYPYLATSPREFWKRWHISLSSWIRDYLYLPLVGEKVQDRSVGGLANVTQQKEKSKNIALFSTWAIMGLWHGANWTFMIWGLYHAICIYIYRILAPVAHHWSKKTKHVCGWMITLPTMMLGWIPFRCESLNDTFQMYLLILQPGAYTWLGMRENVYLVTALVLLLFISYYFISRYLKHFVQNKPIARIVGDTVLYTIAISFTVVFLRPINQFIYFQF